MPIKLNTTFENYECKKCGKEKSAKHFYMDKRFHNGTGICKNCSYLYRLKLRRTRLGLLRSIYYSHFDKRRGKKVYYSFEELVNWVNKNNIVKFNSLYKNWKNNNWNRWLRPSIDRVYDDKDYSLDNIRICSWKENSMKESLKHNKKVAKINEDGKILQVYNSVKEAGKKNNCAACSITNSIKDNKTVYNMRFKYV